MKKILSLLLTLSVAITGFAQEGNNEDGVQENETSEKADGAKITWKANVIDYGTIEKGADGVRTFEFTNTGNEPLIISRVYSSCGCTVPKKPTDPIAPGASDVIEVKYNTNRVGPIRKTISVYSNADSVPYPLKIKGTIVDKKEDE